MQFFLGTHMPNWLGKLDVPLFVSDRRLRGYKKYPVASATWALDSGGFTELSTHGSWDYGPTPMEYAERAFRYHYEIGQLQWAAPQDWMCEPWIVEKTGLTVREHQWRTIKSLLELRFLAPQVKWCPVLQGYTVGDYLKHIEMYATSGVNLLEEEVVGVGSVCRRQQTDEAMEIFQQLHDAGITKLHGFGLKKMGLAKFRHLLTSADSMAWSYDARRTEKLPGCTHKKCTSCPEYAMMWRWSLMTRILGEEP